MFKGSPRLQSGSIKVITNWPDYADHQVALLGRPPSGSIRAIMHWPDYADHQMALYDRSLTPSQVEKPFSKKEQLMSKARAFFVAFITLPSFCEKASTFRTSIHVFNSI